MDDSALLMPRSSLIARLPLIRTMSSSAVRVKSVRAIKAAEAPPAILGESPFWDYKSSLLFYIDILGKRIIAYNPKERSSSSMQLTQQIGFCVPSMDSTFADISLVVGLETYVAEVNFSQKKVVKTISKVPEELVKTGTRFNDGNCSPTGILYGGHMHSQWREGAPYRGALLKLLPRHVHNDKALNVLKMELSSDDVWLPNGSVWCVEDNCETCYLVDSGSHTIKKYQIRSLKFTYVETVYSLPADLIADGYIMDGATIDNCNRIYVVCPNGSSQADKLGLILVIDTSKTGNGASSSKGEEGKAASAATGLEVGRISMPCKKPIACCFGGPELESLFVTSRNEGSGTAPEGLLYELLLDGDVKGSAKYSNIPCKVTSSTVFAENSCYKTFSSCSFEEIKKKFFG